MSSAFAETLFVTTVSQTVNGKPHPPNLRLSVGWDALNKLMQGRPGTSHGAGHRKGHR
jgi:hypothetical protein